MNHFDDTRIQPNFDPAAASPVTPRRPRRGLLVAVAAGVATLAVGGVLFAGSGGDDTPRTQVAGAVLRADAATGPSGSILSTSSPADPPAPTIQPNGDDNPGSSNPGNNNPGNNSNPGTSNQGDPPPTVPPTVPPTTTPPTTVPPPPSAPQLLASPLSLNYGTSTGTRSVTIKNTGGSTLQWSATPDKAWLTVTPAVGTVAPGEETQVQVKALPTGNPGQAWGGSILFNSNGGSFAMPVSGTIKPLIVIDTDLVAVLPVKPTIESVSAPGFVCKHAPIVVSAKVTGQVSSVKVERTVPNATYDMSYNDATDIATKALTAPGFSTTVKVTVKATGPGGTVESAAHNVFISPFC